MFYLTASALVAGDQSKNTYNRDVLQNMISQIGSDGGGTLYIPPGDYYIRCDCCDDWSYYIELEDNVHIVLDPNANLRVYNNQSTEKWCVFRLNGVQNVSIKGGKITGDLTTDLGNKYGIGIRIVQESEVESIPTNILIEDVEVVNCYYDGICIGHTATNIKIINCRCTNNGRNGLSCTGGAGIQIIGGSYSGTNGRSPKSGIDFENETSVPIYNFSIRDVEIRENSGVGLYIHPGSIAGNSGETLYDFDVSGCSIEENGEAGFKIAGNETYDIHRFKVLNNTIQKNKTQGLVIQHANDFLISDNEISMNGSKADEGHRGIEADYVKHFNISNNIIYKNKDNAIMVHSAHGPKQEGDQCSDDGETNAAYNGYIGHNICQENVGDAIDVRSPATLVEGNIVTKNTKNGIIITAFAQNCSISNNVVVENGQESDDEESDAKHAGIRVYSSFCSLTGNLIRKCRVSSTGTVAGATNNSITLEDGKAVEQDGFYVGYYVKITGMDKKYKITKYCGKNAENSNVRKAELSQEWGNNELLHIKNFSPIAYEIVPEIEPRYGIYNVGHGNSLFCNDIRLSGKEANLFSLDTNQTWAANNPGDPRDEVEETTVRTDAKKQLIGKSPRKQFFKIEAGTKPYTFNIDLEADGFVEGDAVEIYIDKIGPTNPTVNIRDKGINLKSINNANKETYAGRFIFNGTDWKVGLWVKNTP